MRLLLYTCGIILLQLLLHTSASVIPSNAPTVPTDTSLLLPNPITRRIWPDPRHRFFVITQAAGLTFFVRFHVLELVPRTDALATLAANDLLRFYKAAFAVANALWAYDEPKTVRRARMNGVLLTFSSEAPIAWDFMKAFFEHIVSHHFLLLGQVRLPLPSLCYYLRSHLSFQSLQWRDSFISLMLPQW